MKPILSKKAQRLCDYLVAGGSTNIGDICRELKTTPRTLLGRTFPEIQAALLVNRIIFGDPTSTVRPTGILRDVVEEDKP